eukprot:gene11956-10324_t
MEKGLFIIKVAFTDFVVRAEYRFDNEMRLDCVGTSPRPKGKEPELSRSRSRSIPPSPGVDASLINKLADSLRQQVVQRLDALERRGVSQPDPPRQKVTVPSGLPPPPVPPGPGPSGLPPSGRQFAREPTGALDDTQPHLPPGWDE